MSYFTLDSECSGPTPDVAHATKTENDTHVTYTCETNYAMSDGKTERTFPCECAGAIRLNSCHRNSFIFHGHSTAIINSLKSMHPTVTLAIHWSIIVLQV